MRCEPMIRAHLFFGRKQASATVLRFLLTEPEMRNLSVCQSQQWVVFTFRYFHRRRKLALDDCAVRVIAKFCWIIFSVGVVVNSFVGDTGKRHARVILERLPRV